MVWRQQRSTRTDTLLPYQMLFRARPVLLQRFSRRHVGRWLPLSLISTWRKAMDVLERELAGFAARAVPPAPTLGSLQRRGLELPRRRRARRLTAGTALVAIAALAGMLVADPLQASPTLPAQRPPGVP